MESQTCPNSQFTGNPPEPAQQPPSTGHPATTVIGKLKNNLGFKSKWGELSGAMGDLGTFIPIVLALTLAKNLDLGTTLIFTGVYNIVTGAIYGVPMPVQPMKSIAAVAVANPDFGIPEIMAAGICTGALTLAKNLDLGTTLIFTGVYNIVTGAIYGVPMPVQPMKSIAAVAVANPDFGIPEIMAAGICTGAILFVLGMTGLMQLVYRIIPLSVVRGIQLAQGLSFAMTAVKYIRKEQDFLKSKSVGERHWLGLDGLALALVCACFILIVNGPGVDDDDDDEHNNDDLGGEGRLGRKERLRRRIIAYLPSAFIIFLLGTVLAILRDPGVVKGFKFGPSSVHIVKISKDSWKQGFIKGTIPQLPLSVLNSVIAVCKLSSDLFPGKDFTATSLSVTVGLMNLVGCWFGVMPTCHGAGGLAGQYKFGGRSGGCVALIGGAKLVLGLVLGSSLVRVLDQFPVGVLGVLLLFAGVELAICCRDMNSKEDSVAMILCTAVSLVGSSAALGFLCGIAAYLLFKLRKLGKI